jgi:DNA repair exonuclease SbcCD ATPase subunit
VSGFELRKLRVTGPGQANAEMTFESGLNVISGPSDTGKSYIGEAIDFMLGGQVPPRQIPESVGYDRAHLLIETKAGKQYELSRPLDGGDFQLCDLAGDEPDVVVLAGRHSATDPANISTFLLRLVGLDQKKLRKNANNELQNLSFRNLASLLIVDEETIIKKGSPILSSEPTQKTTQISLFKLLLTGVDDSALVPIKKRAIAKAEIEGQILVLDELIADYEADLKELTEAPAEELNDQLQRLDASIAASEQIVSAERAEFEAQEQARREAWQAAERIQAREAEITGLKERFALLNQSYASDLQRLESIAEAGAYFVALPQAVCPLCGAPAGDHRHDGIPHDGDIDALRTACHSEIAKIRQLQFELAEAVSDLDEERKGLGSGASYARRQFETADALVRQTLAPALSAARRQIDELYSTRAEVKRALALVERIAAMIARRADAQAALSTAGRTSDEKRGLPAASVQAISVAFEDLLDAWHFPHEKPVFFDEARHDMVLGSRRRGDQGKGLRALTHAAFTIALQQAIKTLGRSPAGFIVLDSPLVTFR